jgi:hypothetical protein
VISLFGFDHAAPPPGTYLAVEGLPHFISGAAGALLLSLAERFELVWCTGWEEKANEYLPALLGLAGPLPYIGFDRHAHGQPGENLHGHWKLGAIDAFAGPSRSVAWVDDRLDDACRAWAAARPGATLLVQTDPAVGLTEEHVLRLLAWAG